MAFRPPYRVMATGLLLVGCESSTAPPHPAVFDFVTGAARDALLPDGTFPPSDTGIGIGLGQGRRLAAAYVRTFLHAEVEPGSLLEHLQEESGRTISFFDLRIGQRWYLALSAYDSRPDLPPELRNVTGPYFIGTLHDPTTPVIGLGVAANATEMGIENGDLVYPRYAGAEFSVMGLPLEYAQTTPPPPEEAVVLVGQVTGAKTIAVPKLYAPTRPFRPHHARWRLVLDRAITVSDELGNTFERSELWVGRGFTLWTPASDQPEGLTATLRDETYFVPRDRGIPGAFIPVTAAR